MAIHNTEIETEILSIIIMVQLTLFQEQIVAI